MSLVATLRGARELLARHGWSESRFLDYGSKQLDVLTAVSRAAGASNQKLVPDVLDTLEAIALPGVPVYYELGNRVAAGEQLSLEEFDEFRARAAAAAKCGSLQAWLEQPGRTQVEVLRIFDLAILKAQSRE